MKKIITITLIIAVIFAFITFGIGDYVGHNQGLEEGFAYATHLYVTEQCGLIKSE